MILTDSHLHSSFSSDSDTPLEKMIQAGIEKGLDSLCITEHYDPDFPDNEDDFDFLPDFDSYEKEIRRLQHIYGDKIEILHGIELGVQPHLQKECEAFYKTYGAKYDFIIHSTHVVDRMDPYYGTYFSSYKTAELAIRHYFETMLENLQIYDNYQTVGHLDYICRYEPAPQTPFSYDRYQEIIDEILLHIIEHNKALEVNTAGWKYGMEDPNPNRQILTRYRALGGTRITIGSDGHKPEHLAYDFYRLPSFLKELGFEHYSYFKKQREQIIDL